MMYWIIGILGLFILLRLFEKKKSPVDALFGTPGEHLSIFNKGFSPVGGMKALTVNQSFRNILICGSTGSFKTAGPLLSSTNTLTRAKCSLIILDVSSEIFKLSSGFMHKRRRRKIYCFDPLQSYDGFNPLDWCKNAIDLDKVARILIVNGSVDSKADPFWSTSSQVFLSFFMQLVFFHGKIGEKNMSKVVDLIDTYMAEPETIDRIVVRSDARLLKMYKTLNATPEKTRQSILSTIVAATRLFRTPEIGRCTSMSTFSIENFRKEPSILYLCIPLHMVNFLAPLTAVLFEMLFQEAMTSVPDKKQLPLFFLIDEMMTMKLDLGLVFSNCRKYKIGCMGVLQDEKMMLMKYSPGEYFAIKSNACTKVYLPNGRSLEQSKELQEIIGKCALTSEEGKERHSYGMEAAQVRTSSEAFVLINSSRPLRLPVIPYFNHFLFDTRTKIPPYMSEQKIKLETSMPETIENI
ncbi:MAG: type IV secretory system conjugative DNA transfer family protein [Chitinophagaceae bacterium]